MKSPAGSPRRSTKRKAAPRRPPSPRVTEKIVADVDATPEEPSKERLQKILAAAGLGSRRQCEELILAGRVTVDGKVIRELGAVVDPENQEVQFDGEVIRPQRKVYWWLNKPPGVLSTSRDTHGRPTVLDMVPTIGQRVYCVGRLDEDSTGLLLMTNDGALADRLTHPRYGVPKTYHVLVAGKVSGATITKLKEGVWLSDGKVRARDIRKIGDRGMATRLQVTLCEGHNREIRRMFARFGHKVMSLARIAIGPIKIRQLKPGESRPATRDEVAMLRKLAQRTPSKKRPAETPETPTRGERGRSAAAPRQEGAAPRKAGTGPRKAGATPHKPGAAPRKAGAAPRKAGGTPRKGAGMGKRVRRK